MSCSCIISLACPLFWIFWGSAKFAFKNPNIKDACGCGESFTVGL